MYPPPPRTLSGPRRRSLLASAAGAALLVGCSSGGEGSTQEASASGSPSVTERTRARAARDSAGLLERYDAVLAAHPTLAVRLAPLRGEVVRHVEAFGGVVTSVSPPASASSAPSSSASASSVSSAASSSASSSASPSGPPSASSSAVPAAVPVDPKSALVSLAGAERTLSDARIAALAEVPGELARLLASVAAAGAAHAFLLTEGAK